MGVAIGVLTLLAGCKKNRKNRDKIENLHNKNKAGRHVPPAGAHRVAYRYSPAKYQAGNHTSYAPQSPVSI